MRPITEDVVIGLMKGLETREKRALAKRAVSDAQIVAEAAKVQRVFPFRAGESTPKARSRKIVTLSEAAKKRRAAKSSRGLFSYISTN